MTERNPLRIMTKPPAEARGAMARLAWMSQKRLPESLHWTVLPDAGEGWSLGAARAVLDRLDAAPFTLTFDQAKGRTGGTAEIHCRRAPPGARLLVESLRRACERAGFAIARKARPHVTLDYAWAGGNFDAPITPIVWEVDRVVLIETVRAANPHVVHGEWRLVPRQGTLFPLRSCDRRAA